MLAASYFQNTDYSREIVRSLAAGDIFKGLHYQFSINSQMNRLTLKKTSALYGRWSFNSKDYVVLDAGLIFDRIRWSHSAPKKRRWF
jgi:hypothetical protein